MGYDFKFEYDSLAKRETYLGKTSVMSEFFGTIFWIFLANRIDVLGSASSGWGIGFNWGLSLLITKAMFEGDFNALKTMARFTEEGDFLRGIINLLVQIVAGMVGTELFGLFGFDGKFDNVGEYAAPMWQNWGSDSAAGYQAHLQLFIALLVYYKIKQNSSGSAAEPAWFFDIVALGIVFALGGEASFLFAPNRVFSVNFADAVGAFKVFWQPYTLYLVYSWLAKFVCNLIDFRPGKDEAMDLLPRFNQN